MSEIDFSELGREIGEKIEKFVNSKEIKDLQDNIRMTVESTMEEVGRSVKEATENVNKSMETHTAKSAEAHVYEPAEKKKQQIKPYRSRQLPVVRRPQGGTSGALLTVFGVMGAVAGGTASLIAYFFSFISMDLLGMGALSLGFSAGFTGFCTLAAIAGGYLRRRAGRFKRYVKTMGQGDFYSIELLAKAAKKKEKYVIKDLKRMIKRGWFREGHLDKQETCFMLTNDAYEKYLNAQEELRLRKEEAERRQREQELLEQDPTRMQLKVTVEEGNEYIRRLREVNDSIPGEEISGKLYRLEKICTRIFEHIEEKPEKLSDIRKFMNYYLPTTLKLVESYQEFSMQPVQGPNISTARTEIEGMLDDINNAFEKMFDKLFEDDAMDVSTDISVLSTMLAQEGLLEDEFKRKKEVE